MTTEELIEKLAKKIDDADKKLTHVSNELQRLRLLIVKGAKK